MADITKPVICGNCGKYHDVTVHIPTFLGMYFDGTQPERIEPACPHCGALNTYKVRIPDGVS